MSTDVLTQKLVAALPEQFREIARFDSHLAIACKAQSDLMQDGAFAEALALNQAIATRLELLARKADA